MARPMKPLVRSGGYYPSNRWTPLVYPGGYTTMNGGEEPAPPPIEKTVTGNPIHILDALAKPAQALSVKLEPIQDLHGYDHPWPAGGGKNLLPKCVSASASGITFTVLDDGTITANGTATGLTFCNAGTFTLPAGTYILNGCPTNSNSVTMDIRNRAGGSGIVPGADAGNGLTFTLTEETSGTVNIRIPSGEAVTNMVFKPMIRLSTVSDATFAPYSNICPISGHTDADVIVSPTLNPLDGTTYPIPLGQTVYGGTLDVVNGTMTVDRAIVDMGSLNWTYSSNYMFFRANLAQHSTPDETTWPTIVSSCYKFMGKNKTTSAMANAEDNTIWTRTNNASASPVLWTVVFVKNLQYTDAETFKTAMSGQTLVYELATPQTIQLTPQQVELLLGENNLFSDGEMTLVYLADGNASDVEALNILLGGRYVNNHTEDEPTDREALDILLGGTR